MFSFVPALLMCLFASIGEPGGKGVSNVIPNWKLAFMRQIVQRSAENSASDCTHSNLHQKESDCGQDVEGKDAGYVESKAIVWDSWAQRLHPHREADRTRDGPQSLAIR